MMTVISLHKGEMKWRNDLKTPKRGRKRGMGAKHPDKFYGPCPSSCYSVQKIPSHLIHLAQKGMFVDLISFLC